MTTAAETDVLDTEIEGEGTENAEGAQVEGETLEGQQTEGAQGTTATDDDEVVVSIGEESPPSEELDNQAPEWVRELRKTSREKDKRIRELEQKLQTTAPATQAVTVGEKPTLAGCDYDEDRFDADLSAWHERKRQAGEEEAKRRTTAEAAQVAWQAKLTAYGKAKAELKVKDFEDAEAVVQETLNVTQQGVILHGADNPALLAYALGKNPKKAKELASIDDPVKFAFAVAKLETQLKVTPRKAVPAPEKTVRGSAPVAPGGVDKKLEQLEAEAEKTGDRSKILAYKRQLKASK